MIATGFVALVFLLIFFAFPETAFRRDEGDPSDSESSRKCDSEVTSPTAPETPPEKISYVRSLNIFHGTVTQESIVKMFFRPFGAILLPPVLWATLVQSVTIGFLVAVSSNVAVAYSEAYGFQTYQIGLAFIAAIVGAILGIPAGGQMGDMMADWLTKRNGGIRNPEMRLPATALSLITAPLSLILYGVGIQRRLHWICPTIGLGLREFFFNIYLPRT
jgi:hypothetical protein